MIKYYVRIFINPRYGYSFFFEKDTNTTVSRKLLHRVNGPALKYVNNAEKWFLNGYQYTEEEFNKSINNTTTR